MSGPRSRRLGGLDGRIRGRCNGRFRDGQTGQGPRSGRRTRYRRNKRQRGFRGIPAAHTSPNFVCPARGGLSAPGCTPGATGAERVSPQPGRGRSSLDLSIRSSLGIYQRNSRGASVRTFVLARGAGPAGRRFHHRSCAISKVGRYCRRNRLGAADGAAVCTPPPPPNLSQKIQRACPD